VVYASSAAVYGDVATVPISEESDCRPLSAYGADKYGCELQARVASHVHAIPTVGLRFFNVYGPRQDPASPYSGVISIFCDKLRRGDAIRIFGDGQQTRDFVFVTDVVAALLSAMKLRPVDAPAFNVCTNIPTTVLDLAHAIGDLLGVSPVIQLAAARSGEIRHSTGSSVRARATLALPEPKALRDGLAKVLDWLGDPG
jgi:UDP-glucose 4-epimerase